MIRKDSIRNGSMGGLLILIFLGVLYVVNKRLLFHPIIGMFPLIVYVGFMITTARYEARLVGAGFKSIFTNTWVTGVIIMLIAQIAQGLLFGVIDPELQDIAIDEMQNALQNMSGILGEQGMEEAMEVIESGNKITIASVLQGALFGLVFPIGVFALIIGGIVYAVLNKK